MAILLTFFGISALILLHELGHYLTARACGMRVSRFCVGFGPTLVRYRGRQTLWQVGAIPLGGYVIIDGMGPDEANETADAASRVAPDAAADAAAELASTAPPTAPIVGSPQVFGPPSQDAHSYRNKPAWQRALVIAAGPAVNWFICACLLAGLAVTSGVAQVDEAQAVVGVLKSGGPAAQGGLQPGDRVQRINDTVIMDWPHLVATVQAHPGQAATFEVVRGQSIKRLQITPQDRGGVGVMEAMPHTTFVTYTLGAGLLEGCRSAGRLTRHQALGLAGLFSKGGTAQLSGLPGIIRAVSQQAETGIARLIESLAYLSIGLCLLNLMPIPALDGGRLLFLGIEVLRRQPVDERIEGIVHTAGFVLLIAVMVFVSARDILRIF